MIHRADDHERGAVALTLAIGVMLMSGLIAAGLLTSVASGASGRQSLDIVRNRQYAADAGVEHAIAQVRSLASPGPALTPCNQGNTTVIAAPSVNGVAIDVHCENNPRVTFSNGSLLLQRNVVFRACLAGVTCDEANTIVRAQVNFEKSDNTSPVTRTYIQSWSVNR